MPKTIAEIVQDHDLKALENFCIRQRNKGGTYRDLRKAAEEAGVDLDELEEMLAEIS